MSDASIALGGLAGVPDWPVALASVTADGAGGRMVTVSRDGLSHVVPRLDSVKPRVGDRVVLVRLAGGDWVLVGALAT